MVRHHPALPYADAPRFMTELSGAAGTAAAMLRFLIFTACRTNEVVDARWAEIDRPLSAWRIPSERMKMNQDHVVPLSEPALAILDEMRNGSQGEAIFQNLDGGTFSENAMLAVLDRLGYGHVSTASDRLSRHGRRNARTIRMASGKRHWRINIRARRRRPISAARNSKSGAL